jgi:hypothetical protein
MHRQAAVAVSSACVQHGCSLHHCVLGCNSMHTACILCKTATQLQSIYSWPNRQYPTIRCIAAHNAEAAPPAASRHMQLLASQQHIAQQLPPLQLQLRRLTSLAISPCEPAQQLPLCLL